MKRDPLLKPAEAALLLYLSERETRALCRRGELRHETQRSTGGRTRYFIPESAVREFRTARAREGERL
ncbi:MAG: helix-turn-helix domain-containing protein [Propionibacteriaceae bacterium]|nr:helix-turn-helix domain-containing protein [Propionibacteriaceae bacterium]